MVFVQQVKYHPVPWLRWPHVSWHQVFRLPEVITMGSWIHDGFAVNILPWTFAVNISWVLLIRLTQKVQTVRNLALKQPRGGPFGRSISAESQYPGHTKINWRSASFDSARLGAVYLNNVTCSLWMDGSPTFGNFRLWKHVRSPFFNFPQQ